MSRRIMSCPVLSRRVFSLYFSVHSHHISTARITPTAMTGAAQGFVSRETSGLFHGKHCLLRYFYTHGHHISTATITASAMTTAAQG